MNRFGKPGDHPPLEHDSGDNDRKPVNDIRRDNDDAPLSHIVTAIYQLELSRKRATLFEGNLGSNNAWDILLLIYIYQESGTPISGEILSRETGLTSRTARRYVDAMRQSGLILPDGLTLSDMGRQRLETYLASTAERAA